MSRPNAVWPATVITALGCLWLQPALAQMDHADRQMQGGGAPDDARDPHAYSGGNTLTEGPYALPGPRQLKLADEHVFWAVLGDRLEYQESADATVFDVQGWYGTTYDRLVIKTEGDFEGDTLEEASTDLLWGRALNAYFDLQAGLRLDYAHEGENRQWLALGVQGLASYWFEVDVTAYLGESGRTALAAEAEYDVLLTQRWVLQPRAEVTLYGKDAADNGIGSGLSSVSLGVRLRYEFTRQFAPYVGVEWASTYGDTADYVRASGQERTDTQVLAGITFWF